MFFSEKVSAYEVLFDVLLMQSRLYGLDKPDKAELCLNIIITHSSKIGDVAAQKTALRSLIHLYAATERYDEEQRIFERLQKLDKDE